LILLLNELIGNKVSTAQEKHFKKQKLIPTGYRIDEESFKMVKLQLRALKLMKDDGDSRWRITSHGDAILTRLLALKRTPKKNRSKS